MERITLKPRWVYDIEFSGMEDCRRILITDLDDETITGLAADGEFVTLAKRSAWLAAVILPLNAIAFLLRRTARTGRQDAIPSSPKILMSTRRPRVEAVSASLDHEPEKLAQGAAKALAAISGCTAAVSTPCAEDLCVAHYEVVQVGRSAAAVLAVTTAGYVRTRVARVRTGLSRENAAALAALLNRNLTFVAPVDLSNRLLAELCSQIDPELVPVISAAAAILQDSAQPHVFLGGEQYLLNWPQLEGKVGDILTLLNDEEQAAHIIAPPADRSESVLLGEDLEPQIPGLCIVSDRYLVGGGLWGTVALIGPTRMPFQKLMPLLHLFADELGEGMSGKRKDTPQMAAPRRTVIYKEDLE